MPDKHGFLQNGIFAAYKMLVTNLSPFAQPEILPSAFLKRLEESSKIWARNIQLGMCRDRRCTCDIRFVKNEFKD
jgi:hypothetical protein